MGTATGKCSVCGASLVLEVPPPFDQATLVSPICNRCAERQLLDRGGTILQLTEEVPGALFPLGTISVTPGALALLSQAEQHATEFVLRHACGDWGQCGRFDAIELTEEELRLGWEATEDTARQNKSNVLNRRDSVRSEYRTANGQRLWVLTDLDRGGRTTVFLPADY